MKFSISTVIAATLILTTGVGISSAKATQIQEDTAQLSQLDNQIQDAVTVEGRRRGSRRKP